MTVLAPEDVVALVPCHREPPAEALVRRLVAQLPRVLVVNDGMPAERAERLDRLAAALDLRTVHLTKRSGKGHALVAGFAALRAWPESPRAVLTFDSDGQHPPEAIPDFIAAADRAELVIGNRFADGARGMPAVRHATNQFSSALISHTSGVRVPDGQCGLRLLRGRALFDVPFPGGHMESETRHLKRCLRAGVAVAWVPIPAIYRNQRSSFRTVRDSMSIMRYALAP